MAGRHARALVPEIIGPLRQGGPDLENIVSYSAVDPRAIPEGVAAGRGEISAGCVRGPVGDDLQVAIRISPHIVTDRSLELVLETLPLRQGARLQGEPDQGGREN